jgi:hypothetical protein
MEQLAIELHKPVIKKIEKRRVEVSNIDETFAADLVDMNYWKKYNNNNRYILTVIDIFSKFAWGIPLQTKTGVEITKAFKTIFKDRVPENLWVDQGSEFYNKDFKVLLNKHDINMYSTHGDHKSAVVERFNRTLKEKMEQYFTASNESLFKWVLILPTLLKTYNNTVHRTIKMTPIEGSEKKNEDEVYMNANDRKPIKIISKKFRKENLVRLSKIKKTFEKGYTNNWTREVFKIAEVLDTEPVTYKIKEYDDTLIEGSFYTQELQKVDTNIIFQLDAVLKTRTKKGKKEHFVHWFGWGSKYDSWISDSTLNKLL